MTFSEIYANVEKAITQLNTSQQMVGELQVYIADYEKRLYRLRAEANAMMSSNEEGTQGRLRQIRNQIVDTNQSMQRYQHQMALETEKLRKSVKYLTVSRSELRKVVSELNGKCADLENSMTQLSLAEGQFAYLATAQRDKLDVSYRNYQKYITQANALISRIDEALNSASGNDVQHKVLRRK